MEEKNNEYKGYDIAIHPQPHNGDSAKVFFRVTKNEISQFTHWQTITGTEGRDLSTNALMELLEDDGIKNIQSRIDNNNFAKDAEYESYSSNRSE